MRGKSGTKRARSGRALAATYLPRAGPPPPGQPPSPLKLKILRSKQMTRTLELAKLVTLTSKGPLNPSALAPSLLSGGAGMPLTASFWRPARVAERPDNCGHEKIMRNCCGRHEDSPWAAGHDGHTDHCDQRVSGPDARIASFKGVRT